VSLGGERQLPAEDWPQFRGTAGLGYTTETNLPLKWSRSDNLAWSIEIPKADNAYSSPIVAKDRVFLTTASNQPLEHHVLCFSAKSGELLWDTSISPGPWILKDLRGGYGAPTPCTDGKMVVVLFGSAVVAALDYNGKIKWRKELENYNFDVALGSSPFIYKDTVVLDCDQNGNSSYFLALDLNSGETRWRENRPQVGFAHSTPVIIQVNGLPQMVVSASNALQGMDPETGKLVWWCAAAGDSSSPAYASDLIFSDSGRGGKAVCVSPTGTGDVMKTHLKWTYPQIPEGLSSAVIAPREGAVTKQYVFRTHKPETLKCIALASGQLAFSERLPDISTWSSPFVTPEGNVYFANAGKSYVLKADSKLELLATNDLGEESRASAAVSNGKIYIRGNKHLFCIGRPAL
jgi:outer membrane protein assembly factor BamB